jgi:hypothetical protein
MISRRTTLGLAEMFAQKFGKYHRGSSYGYGNSSHSYYTVDTAKLYDYLFGHEYPAWLCNSARSLFGSVDTRPLKEFIMKLHTGESLANATQGWTWKQREQLGQQYLFELAEDVLNDWNKETDAREKNDLTDLVKGLHSNLELDGYTYQNSRLLIPERDVLDVAEKVGVLETLFTSLALENKDTALHHLRLSEEHYIAAKWDDSISNSRKFLEVVLREVAISCSVKSTGTRLSESTYTHPVNIRDYLEKQGLLDTKEKQALASVYGLLSEKGSHPYMAQSEQARLLRHLALTFAQFVMLRYQGWLSKS